VGCLCSVAMAGSAARGAELLEDLETLLEYELESSYNEYVFPEGICSGLEPRSLFDRLPLVG
jgi:hypothetical protein